MRSACPVWPTALSSIRRTAVYGPVRTVVWEGWAGNRSPYPDLVDTVGRTLIAPTRHLLSRNSAGRRLTGLGPSRRICCMSLETQGTSGEPCTWFSARLEYEGDGRAEFRDPPGRVLGPVKVSVSETGKCQAEMEIRSVECPDSQDELSGFLVGKRIPGSPTVVESGLGSLDWNRCEKLTVDCTNGVFTAAGDVRYDFPEIIDGGTGGPRKVVFHPYQSKFESKSLGEMAYWVLPLCNFLSAFHTPHPKLGDHPLRVFSTSPVPRKASGLAPWPNPRNRLITFQCADSPGFIEPLPDYEQLEDDLLKGRAQHHITSIAVGTFKLGLPDSENLEQWLPLLVELVLGLATGRWVSTPWIEFRSADGQLMRRLHIRSRNSPFVEARGAIDEGLMRGTGHLLSRALVSESPRDKCFQAAMRFSIRAGLRQSLTVEDMVVLNVRGIECLCRYLKLNSEDLMGGLAENSKREITERVENAAREVGAIVRTAYDNENESNRTDLAKRIAQRVTGSTKPKPRGFGSSVIAVLDHYGFQDRHVGEEYYKLHPELGTATWVQRLTRYRGRVFHYGFLDDRAEILDAFTICDHLRDILLRCILKELGYEGHYQPATIPALSPRQVDWVTRSTQASDLGYGGSFRTFT